MDFELKKQVADFFLFRPDTVERDITEEKLIEDMELCWMAVRRDGSKEVRYRDPKNGDAEVCFPL